eukprot:5288227-Pyramimonas_sp.AAC.1
MPTLPARPAPRQLVALLYELHRCRKGCHSGPFWDGFVNVIHGRADRRNQPRQKLGLLLGARYLGAEDVVDGPGQHVQLGPDLREE